jgi:hypothetical protein
MAVDGRHKNANWEISNPQGNCRSVGHATLAILMDIRDELQTLNCLLGCPNFTGIPETLRQIAKHTRTKRKYTKGPL